MQYRWIDNQFVYVPCNMPHRGLLKPCEIHFSKREKKPHQNEIDKKNYVKKIDNQQLKMFDLLVD